MLQMYDYKKENTEATVGIWVTAKSFFVKDTIAKLLSPKQVIGIRFNLTKEKQLNKLENSIKYINNNYPNKRIMLDFGGKKERIKLLENKKAIKENEIIELRKLPVEKGEVMNYKNTIIYISEDIFNYISSNLHRNDKILISDGWQQLEVLSSDDICITCSCLFDSVLYDNRGISVKGYYDKLEQNYDQDVDKYNILVEKGCNITDIALSFVNSSNQIIRMRNILKNNCEIIAKVETLSGIRNLGNILEECNISMLGRGDLLVELSYYDYSFHSIEEMYYSLCQALDTEYILATRVADSLEENEEMSVSELLYLRNEIKKMRKLNLLLSNETSFDESKSINNLMKILNNIRVINSFD